MKTFQRGCGHYKYLLYWNRIFTHLTCSLSSYSNGSGGREKLAGPNPLSIGFINDLVAGVAQENETIEASAGGHFVGVLTISTLFARPLLSAHTYKAVIWND